MPWYPSRPSRGISGQKNSTVLKNDFFLLLSFHSYHFVAIVEYSVTSSSQSDVHCLDFGCRGRSRVVKLPVLDSLPCQNISRSTENQHLVVLSFRSYSFVTTEEYLFVSFTKSDVCYLVLGCRSRLRVGKTFVSSPFSPKTIPTLPKTIFFSSIFSGILFTQHGWALYKLLESKSLFLT